MKRTLLVGSILLLTFTALYSEELYKLSVDVTTRSGQDTQIWNNHFERVLEADESEAFLFTGANGSVTVTLSLHPIDEENFLLVAGSDIQLNDGEQGPMISANLKSISLKKGEKVVYYPLGRTDENSEGGQLFFLELVVRSEENGNI